MHKKYFFLEAAGVAFSFSGCIFMRNLYRLSNYGLSGVLFGSVNSSAWEYSKTLLLPFVVWSLIELLCVGGKMRRLTVAKTAAACVLLIVYLSVSMIFLQSKDFETSEITVAVLSLITAAATSYFLINIPLKLETVFPAALCALFLLMAFYFSFTPFPPENKLFADKISGLRGIPPLGYDFGADIL